MFQVWSHFIRQMGCLHLHFPILRGSGTIGFIVIKKRKQSQKQGSLAYAVSFDARVGSVCLEISLIHWTPHDDQMLSGESTIMHHFIRLHSSPGVLHVTPNLIIRIEYDMPT